MIKYNWIIESVERQLVLNELQDVIKFINWRYIGIDENEISLQINGCVSVPEPNKDNFTIYSDLTKEDIIVWLENILDVEDLKITIENQIQLIKNPIIIIEPLYEKIK